MKVLLCETCHDLVVLKRSAPCSCWCGDVSGQYDHDGRNAWYSGGAIPLGVDNEAMALLLKGYATAASLQVGGGKYTRKGRRLRLCKRVWWFVRKAVRW